MESGSSIPASFGHPVSEKLTKSNYALWKVQVLPAIRGAQLTGYIDGTKPAPPTEIDGKVDGKDAKVMNPDYTKWLALDQQVFSYLVASLSRDVLSQVANCTTAAQIWAALEEMYSSRIRARAVNTRISLATLKKGAMSISEYFSKMRELGDEMASAGKPLDDEDLVSYILTGLDMDFNPIVSAVLARVEPISVGELYTQLLAFEQRLDLFQTSSGSSANAATRGGRGGNRGGRGCGSNRGRGNGGRSRGGYNGGNSNNSRSKSKIKCQVCLKEGHSAVNCWYRFDEDFVPPEEKTAAAASNNYGIDTN